jgi:hypothetical protein
MSIINCHLQKALKKHKAGDGTIINSITYGETLFQNFAFKNSAENFGEIIWFCVEYQISIINVTDIYKRSVNDISIAIADALFDLKFNFNLPYLLQLTKLLVENELGAVQPKQSDNIITLKEAAIELSMSVQTIRNRAKKGEIPIFAKTIKGYRFEKGVLLEWGRNYRNYKAK